MVRGARQPPLELLASDIAPMKLQSTLTLCVSLLLALNSVGCGKQENADVNEAAAKTQVNTAIQAVQSLQGGKNGQSAATELMSLGAGSLTMLKPKGGDEKRSAALGAQLDMLAKATEKGAEGCECTAKKCTFTKCGVDGEATFNGTIEWSETSLKCDYSIEMKHSALELNFSTTCDLKFSETSLDGTLSSEGSSKYAAAGQSGGSKWDTSMQFDGVKWDKAGKAIGGKVTIEASLEVEGQEDLYGKSEIDLGS